MSLSWLSREQQCASVSTYQHPLQVMMWSIRGHGSRVPDWAVRGLRLAPALFICGLGTSGILAPYLPFSKPPCCHSGVLNIWAVFRSYA